MVKNTYWLASYPKSGNTWFRLFLNQLLGPEQQLNINDLPIKNTIASDRTSFDLGLGINSSDLLQSEIDHLRPYSDEVFNQALTEPMFRKIHDAYISPYSQLPITSKQISAGVIYIVRSPLDVLVSYSHHLNKSIDITLKRLNGVSDIIKTANTATTQLNQYMGGWSNHVLSWTEQTDIPVHLVRYEDLLAEPLKHFSSAVKFAKITSNESKIKQAIDNTSFSKLKQKEIDGRFAETPRHSKRFFRKGIAGGWKDDLTTEHVKQVIEKHRAVMQTLGYLNKNDTLTY